MANVRKDFLKKIILFVSVAFFTFFWNMGEGFIVYAKEQDRIVVVEVIHPVKRTLEAFTTITGTCVSLERSVIGAKVSGTIVAMMMDEGDRVKKGRILAKLDDTDYELNSDLIKLQLVNAKAQVESGNAEIKKARMDLNTKKIDFDRIENVYNRGSFPKQKFDHAQNMYEAALSAFKQAEIRLKILKNQVTSLETQVKIARKKISDCRIIAPFSCVISARLANTGEWVAPGKPIFILETDDPIEIEGEISEIYLERLEIGMPVRVAFDGMSKFCSETGGSCETVLTEISPVVDPRRRTLKVTVQLENPDHKLKAGLYARMQIIFDKANQTVVIPQMCIISRYDSPHIYVIKNNKAEIQKIETGIKEGEWVEVRSGLDLDSIVVYAGHNQLLGGEKVKLQYREVR